MPTDKETAILSRLIAEASVLAGGQHPCAVLGHKWVFMGGASRSLEGGGYCSVPVYECEACGDCDYGDNPEAAAIMAEHQRDALDAWEGVKNG
jgi:hypothetical protein